MTDRERDSAGVPADRRAPARILLVALVLAAALGGLAARSGGFGARVGGPDLYGALVPKYRHTAEAFLAGRFPLWNPYEYCGLPLHGAAQGSVLYLPFALANMLFAPFAALQAIYHVHLAALLAVLMLYLTRVGTTLTAGALGAAVAAACFFNDPSTSGPDHPHYLVAAICVPVILCAWDALVAGRRAAAAVIGLAAGVQWLAGYPEFPMDTAVVLVLVAALGRGWSAPRRLGAAVALLALGALVGAVQILPLAEAVAESARTAGRGFFPAQRAVFAVQGAGQLADLALGRYGAAALLCLSVGLVTPGRNRLPWAAALVWSVFATNRPFAYLYDVLPYSLVRFAFGWELLEPLFAGCLVAAGLDRLRRPPRGGRAGDWLPAALGAGLAGLAAMRDQPLDAAVAGACAVALLPPLGRRGGWMIPIALAAAHAAGVMSRIGTTGYMPAPDLPAAERRAAVLRRLHETLPAQPRVVAPPELRAGLLLGAHVPSPAGYEPSVPPRRMTRLGVALGFEALWYGRERQEREIWRRLAVHAGAASALGVGLVAVPAAETGGLAAVGYERRAALPDGDVVLYRRPVPRFHVVHTVLRAADEEESLRRLLAPGFDPAASVILEEVLPLPPDVPTGALGNGEGVELRSETPERIRLEAALVRPGILVIRDAYYPGWEATVDGVPARIQRANYAFRALALAAGTHRVELAYRPLSLRLGAAATAVGLALTVGLWLSGRKAGGGPRPHLGARRWRREARARAMALPLLLLLAACAGRDRNGDGVVRVVCVGDSNTCYGSAGVCEIVENYCARLAAAFPRWQFVNRGLGGATAGDYGVCFDGVPRGGRWHLARAIAEDAADIVLLGFGTNDAASFTRLGRTIDQVLADFEALVAMALAAHVDVLVLTVPPRYDDGQLGNAVTEINRRLRARWPERVVDSDGGFDRSDMLPDGVHLNAAGQQKRAQRVSRALGR